MRAYLVRLTKDTELVGLFVSPSLDRLYEFIDECCDPFSCEYLALPPGGLYLSQAGAAKVPTIIKDPEDDRLYPDFFSGATVSELWMEIFYGPDDGNWKPIKFPVDGITAP